MFEGWEKENEKTGVDRHKYASCLLYTREFILCREQKKRIKQKTTLGIGTLLSLLMRWQIPRFRARVDVQFIAVCV